MSHDNPHACYWCRQQPCKGGSGNGSCQDKPAPSPQPEMPEEGTALFFLNEEAMRDYLRSKGLHVVKSDDPRLGFLDVNDMAEWLGEEPRCLHIIDAQQKAVLDAWKLIPESTLRDWTFSNIPETANASLNELARRRM